MAVLVFAGAAFNSVSAQSKKKDKKNKQKTECAVECKKEGSAQPVQLKTASDSLSYAAGVVMTRGLGGVYWSAVWCDEGTDANVYEGACVKVLTAVTTLLLLLM